MSNVIDWELRKRDIEHKRYLEQSLAEEIVIVKTKLDEEVEVPIFKASIYSVGAGGLNNVLVENRVMEKLELKPNQTIDRHTFSRILHQHRLNEQALREMRS